VSYKERLQSYVCSKSVKGHAWPPRSPDLNPLDFYLGVIQSLSFKKRRRTAEMNYFRKYWTLQSEHGTLQTFLRGPSVSSLPRRATQCVAVNGTVWTFIIDLSHKFNSLTVSRFINICNNYGVRNSTFWTSNTRNSVAVPSRIHVSIIFFIQNELIYHLLQFVHFLPGHPVELLWI
jgi:hypothetical protein